MLALLGLGATRQHTPSIDESVPWAPGLRGTTATHAVTFALASPRDDSARRYYTLHRQYPLATYKDASVGIALQALVTLLKMLGIAAPRWALQHMALKLTR